MLDLRDVKITINLRLKAIDSADIKMLIPEIPTMWVAFPSVKKDIHQVRSRVLQNRTLVQYIAEDTGRKFHVHKTFSLCPVSTG